MTNPHELLHEAKQLRRKISYKVELNLGSLHSDYCRRLRKIYLISANRVIRRHNAIYHPFDGCAVELLSTDGFAPPSVQPFVDLGQGAIL